MVGGYNTSSSVKDPEGNKKSKSLGVSFDPTKQQASGNFATSTADADGNVRKSVAVGGTLGKDGASGDVSAARGKNNVSLSGGIRVHASDPRKLGEKWFVDWTALLKGGGAVGHGPGNISGNASKEYDGTTAFASYDEAELFAKGAAHHADKLHGVPNTVDAAMANQPGEKAGETTDVGGGLGLSANVEGANVGVGANADRKRGVELARVSANIFEAEINKSDLLGANFSEGGAGIKAGISTTKTTSGKTRLRFDISTEQGKAALQAFLDEPRRILPGVKVISEKKDTTGETTESLGGFGVASDRIGTTHDTVEKTEEGETRTHSGELARSVSHKSLGHDEASEKFVGKRITKHGETTDSYELDAHVSSDSAQEANKELAQATGTTWQTRDKRDKASGSWNLSSELTEAQVMECARTLLKGGDLSALTTDYSDGAELVAALRASTDPDALMKAFSSFVAKNGAKGFAVIRENISAFRTTGSRGERHMVVDIALQGDANFLGQSGHARQQDEIKYLQAELKNPNPDRSGLSRRALTEINDLRRKINGISDTSRYHDLPDEIRREEIQRLNGYLAALHMIREVAEKDVVRLDSRSDASPGSSEA